MIPSPEKQKQIPSCSNMSQNKALNQIKELLGYDDLDIVPTGPGRDYLTTLVLVARGYNFGGITFEEATEKISGTDWNKTDRETEERKKILEAGKFYRFI